VVRGVSNNEESRPLQRFTHVVGLGDKLKLYEDKTAKRGGEGRVRERRQFPSDSPQPSGAAVHTFSAAFALFSGRFLSGCHFIASLR